MTQRRDFDALSEAQIAAGRTQKRWVEPKAQFRPAAPQAVTELLDMIQHVAEAATGERSFLHLRPGPDPRPLRAIGASRGAGGSHGAGSKP